MLIAYIAHPIGGDVSANIKRVEAIVRQVNTTEPHVVPFAPYLVDLRVLDDDDPKQRARGMANNEALIKSGAVDIIRLYGHTVSAGMIIEANLALDLGIPVIATNATTAVGLAEIKRARREK